MQQWKYGYTIRTGERHLRTGAACQDSVFALEDEKCIVMALCDGIGSLSRSGRTAQLAAAAACHILRKCADINFYHHAEVPNGMMKDLLESVDRFVTGKFREEGADHSQGDCTLAFVFVSKLFDFGFAGSLGDSAVCLIRKSGNTCLTESNANLESTASLHIREPWRFAKSETFCLGDDFWGAILTSDGMDGEIYTKNSSQVFRRAQVYFNAAQTDDMKQTLAELAETAVRNSGGELDDDISIAVLSRAEDDVLFPQDVTWLCACGARNRLENSYCFRCGRDFLTLYSSVSFAKYGGKTHFFATPTNTARWSGDFWTVSSIKTNECCKGDAKWQSNLNNIMWW